MKDLQAKKLKEVIFFLEKRIRKCKAKPLTMLMYKSQPRQHLKYDVPNFILCEHLILSTSKPRNKKKERYKRS